MRDGITDLRRAALVVACVTAVFLAVLVLIAGPAVAQEEDPPAVEEQYDSEASPEGCENPQEVATFTGTENQRTETFEISGETFRITYETEPVGADPFLPTVEVDVLKEQGQPIREGFLVFDGEDGSENILAGPGTFRLEIRADEASYTLVVADCQPVEVPPSDPSPGKKPPGVIHKTIPKQPLPPTGGIPFAGLAVVGLALLGVGSSIACAGVGRRS